jgi:hypothetical protein
MKLACGGLFPVAEPGVAADLEDVPHEDVGAQLA